LSASKVEVHDRVEVLPLVIVVGLKEAVQVGALTVTETVAEHVVVAPAPFCAVSVQVWIVSGDVTVDPLAPERGPLPKFPVQLYGIFASASFVDVHDRVEV